MKKTFYLLPLLILLTLSSCNGLGVDSFRGSSDPNVHPSDSSLIGTWTIDQKSYDLIKEKFIYSGQEVKLVLFEDSTFKAYNFIDFDAALGKDKLMPGKFLDATGRWSVVYASGYWGLEMHFNSGKLHPRGMGMTYDLFLNDSIVTGIQFFTDDPDSGDRMVFRKEESQEPKKDE